MKILETARLTLRTIELDDAAFYLELVNHASYIGNIGDKGIRTLEAARAALEDGALKQQRENGFSFYLVARRSDGAPLGICGLVKRDSLPDADIGYAFAPAYWGQGYAYEAAAAVVAYAQHTLALKRLLGLTSLENQRSIKLLKKLGLRFERFTRLPPGGLDTNVYRREFPV